MLNMLKLKFKLTITINHFLLNFKIYFNPLLNNQLILLMEQLLDLYLKFRITIILYLNHILLILIIIYMISF